MARKTTDRRRPRRRPNVPPPGGHEPAPRKGGAAPRASRGRSAPTTVMTVSDENLGETYHHVAVDLRRILVLAVIMFALILGAKMLADTYGTSFVLDLLR